MSRQPVSVELQAAVEALLKASGLDPATNADVAETPARVARLWQSEFLAGYDMDPAKILMGLELAGCSASAADAVAAWTAKPTRAARRSALAAWLLIRTMSSSLCGITFNSDCSGAHRAALLSATSGPPDPGSRCPRTATRNGSRATAR